MRELAYDAAGAEDPNYLDHYIYEFEVLDTNCNKRIRSCEGRSVKDWLPCFEHVRERAGKHADEAGKSPKLVQEYDDLP